MEAEKIFNVNEDVEISVADKDQDLLTIIDNDGKNLVSVKQTGDVIIHKLPDDKAAQEAALLFWNAVSVQGKGLLQRIAELENKLEVIKISTNDFQRTTNRVS